MGREVVATCEWRGQRAEVKALLEGTEIILRGEIKARIARSGIKAVTCVDDEVRITAGKDKLVLELGAKEAAKWQEILSKPPPTLASKLGISPGARGFVIGKTSDKDLATALKGNETKKAEDASVLIAALQSSADLKAAYKFAKSLPKLMLWCVYPKGKSASISESDVRGFMRENGYVDSKTCAVSATLTATRFGKAK